MMSQKSVEARQLKTAQKHDDAKQNEEARIEAAVEERLAKYKIEFQRSEAKRIRERAKTEMLAKMQKL